MRCNASGCTRVHEVWLYGHGLCIACKTETVLLPYASALRVNLSHSATCIRLSSTPHTPAITPKRRALSPGSEHFEPMRRSSLPVKHHQNGFF